MKSTYIALGVLLLAGFALTGTASADTASATVEGACTYEDQGGEDSASVSTEDGASGPENLEGNAAACAAAASNGELPHGGSFLAASASAADGTAAVGANSVPVSDLITGQDDSAASSAEASGACHYGDDGGEDAGSIILDGEPSADTPDEGEVEGAATACANAAANGDTPEGGSFLRASASVLGGAATAGADTVPASDALAP